ncbi:MAG: hypothetical protein RLZ55_1455 [Actinomycetota bacterium]
MTVEFVGEVHPLAAVWPMLTDGELEGLADSIACNGLRDPIVLDMQGRLVDGRNRLEACVRAGVEPRFVVDEVLTSDEVIADFVSDKNAERRHLKPGQQAMGRGLMLKAAGRRKNGRWERGSVTNVTDGSDGARVLMVKAGLVLDVADRAAVLGDSFAAEASLPQSVLDGSMSLDYAHKAAQQFDGKAAMAEALKYQPVIEAIGRLEVILDDAERLLPIPTLEVPLRRDHHKRLGDIARRANQLAATIRRHSEESK